MRIRVFGKVQGVFFRANAKAEAEQLALTGFAHNLPDGSVGIEVAGDLPKLERFIAWCHEGSADARVENVLTEEVIGGTLFADFSIR